MNRHSFYWWDDAVWAARSLTARTGMRHRVTKGTGSNPWVVRPAVVRLVEVPC